MNEISTSLLKAFNIKMALRASLLGMGSHTGDRTDSILFGSTQTGSHSEVIPKRSRVGSDRIGSNLVQIGSDARKVTAFFDISRRKIRDKTKSLSERKISKDLSKSETKVYQSAPKSS